MKPSDITMLRIDSMYYYIDFEDRRLFDDKGRPIIGCVSYVDKRISIDAGIGGEQSQLQTLLHEMFHAILYERGVSGIRDEEILVESLASAVLQIVMDNPDIGYLLMGAKENAIEKRKIEEDDKRKHSDRDRTREIAEASNSDSDGGGGEEQEKGKKKKARR